MPFYTQPSGASGNIALKSATALAIGGLNFKRSSIVMQNLGTEAIWLLWGTSATVPTATAVKAQGVKLLNASAGGVPLTLGAHITQQNVNGTIVVTPVLYGVGDSEDQSSPADTRWAEPG